MVALTNLPALVPIFTAYSNNDLWTCAALCFVATASFISHLVENHKHGMPGFLRGVSVHQSLMWMRIDQLACDVVLLRFLVLLFLHPSWPQSLFTIMYKEGVTLACLFTTLQVSEYDKYNPTLKHAYIFARSWWHIEIFFFLNRILSVYIYSDPAVKTWI